MDFMFQLTEEEKCK